MVWTIGKLVVILWAAVLFINLQADHVEGNHDSDYLEEPSRSFLCSRYRDRCCSFRGGYPNSFCEDESVRKCKCTGNTGKMESDIDGLEDIESTWKAETREMSPRATNELLNISKCLQQIFRGVIQGKLEIPRVCCQNILFRFTCLCGS